MCSPRKRRDERLLALLETGGLTYEAIAKQLQVSIQTVLNDCRRLGVKKADMRRKSDPQRVEMARVLVRSNRFSITEICEALSLDRTLIYRHGLSRYDEAADEPAEE